MIEKVILSQNRCLDKPGVLADITSFLKRQKISISNMFQLEKKYQVMCN